MSEAGEVVTEQARDGERVGKEAVEERGRECVSSCQSFGTGI